jgi:hypothetical protein
VPPREQIFQAAQVATAFYLERDISINLLEFIGDSPPGV